MINDICHTAKEHVNYSLFADDVAIWSTQQDHNKAEKHVQQGLNQIESWCRKWGFTLSAEKSAAVAFNRSRNRTNTRLFIDGKPVLQINDTRFRLYCVLMFNMTGKCRADSIHFLHVKYTTSYTIYNTKNTYVTYMTQIIRTLSTSLAN